MYNLTLLTDSYKLSHYLQYPQGAEKVYSYMEAREGGEYEDIVFFGLKYYLLKYLQDSVLSWDIFETDKLAEEHGLPFNKKGWQRIIDRHSGFLPLHIQAVPELDVYQQGEVLLTIENTDPELPWLTNYMETLLMKLWYPCTVATKAYSVKRMLKDWYDITSDKDVDFSYHNFGDRGSTSVDAAMIGGMAHLTQFKGTDNLNAVKNMIKYYGQDYMGYSIPATEHSTVTSWGKENEYPMIDNFIDSFRGYPLIACVLDSYNIYDAVNYVTSGDAYRKISSDDYPNFVIRPDSGNPIQVIKDILEIMNNNDVDFTVNSKGYKSYNNYNIIWGDGVNPTMMDSIMCMLEEDGYASDVVVFGSGGDLMQNVNRDTCRFATKASAIQIGSQWYDVYKDPVTDSSKKSKKGRVTNDKLQTVYLNGEVR